MASGVKVRHSRHSPAPAATNSSCRAPFKTVGCSVIISSRRWLVNLVKGDPDRRADPKRFSALSRMGTPARREALGGVPAESAAGRI